MPEGWIWQDIGNYYGVPCFGFNWHENLYDLYLQPGEKEGSQTSVVSTNPKMADINLRNSITTGAKGSGDNSIIYSSPFSNLVLTKGTIQLQKGSFKISGSMVNPSKIFKDDFVEYLRQQRPSHA